MFSCLKKEFNMAFVYIKPAQFLVNFHNALLSESPEELEKFSAPLEQAFVDIKNWANQQLGGRCISSFGESICLDVSIDKLSEVAAFMKRWEYSSKVLMSIGVGNTPLEAFKAMAASDQKDGDEIVFYSDELDAEEELTKNEYSFDLPGLELDKDEPVEGDSSVEPDGVKSEDDSVKQKIMETLLLLKEKAPIIQKLKEIDPQSVGVIKKVIDAMILMATKMKKAEESESSSESSSSESGSESSSLDKGDNLLISNGKIRN